MVAFNDTTGAVAIQTGATTGPEAFIEWIFENDGNLTLPEDGAINFANGTNILSTISSIGNITVSGSDITGTGSNVTITADTTDYVFYANGTVRTDGALTIVVPSGTPTGVANWAGGGGWNQAFYSNIATTGGTGTGLTVDVAAGGGGYIVIGTISINNPGSGYTDGDVITINNENNIPGSFTVVVVSKNWEFDGTGNLILPQGSRILDGNSPAWGYKSIDLYPGNAPCSDQYLRIYPTVGGDGCHLHLTSGNLQLAELFLGNDDQYVKLVSTGAVDIRSDNMAGNSAVWTFGTDGNITLPSGGNLITSTGSLHSISLDLLKSIVASSSTWGEFQANIAAL